MVSAAHTGVNYRGADWASELTTRLPPAVQYGFACVEIGKSRLMCRSHQTEGRFDQAHPGQILVRLRKARQHGCEEIAIEDLLVMDIKAAGPNLPGL